MPGEEAERGPGGPLEYYLRSILRQLVEIKASIEAVEERLDSIESRLRALEASGRRRASYGRPRSPQRVPSVIEESLSGEGYILASDAGSSLGLSPRLLIETASRLPDIRVIHLGGDALIIREDALEGFTSMLRSVKSSDPEEASAQLAPYSRLFRALWRNGLLYYDSRSSSWKLLGLEESTGHVEGDL